MLEKIYGSNDDATTGHAQLNHCLHIEEVAQSEVHNLGVKMPDYLGKDQRKTKDDDVKDEKPIQGWLYVVDCRFTSSTLGPVTL